MHLIKFKGRNSSNHNNLNLLHQDDKTFIMDNHLAASWCWAQKINLKGQYNLFHIDRHYDMLESQMGEWLKELKDRNFDFRTTNIEDLLDIDYAPLSNPTNDRYQLFRWDNYLTVFHNIYPNLINFGQFATHEDGDKLDYFDIYEAKLWELPENLAYWINDNSSNQWILNIDIDYFFQNADDNYFQFLTDQYVQKIGQQIKESWSKIDVLTIALSPELCGGWEQSERVAELLCESIGIKYPLY